MAENNKRNPFLDEKRILALNDIINDSPVFLEDDRLKKQYNLICAVMDRLSSCVRYLNDFPDYPETEEDFISFMTFACMAKDAINISLHELKIKEKGCSTKYFQKYCLEKPLCIPENECPDDDKFFEYFRALTFAHPFETSRPKFLKDRGEVQYSPWVIVNRRAAQVIGESDAVGVRIYTNKSDDILDLRIPFSVLKDYIKSKYQEIELLIQWAKNAQNTVEEEWKKQKIDRDQSAVKILEQIEKILEVRYSDTHLIRRAIQCLTCSVTDTINEEPVREFRKAITDIIPKVCDAVENLDENEMDLVLSGVLSASLQGHNESFYQLQKIYEYLVEKNPDEENPDEQNLDEENKADIRWPLIQAQNFAEGFAKKWVKIRPYDMSFSEIQLLVRTACYLEANSQEKSGETVEEEFESIIDI